MSQVANFKDNALLALCRAGRALRWLPGAILSLGCLFLVGAFFPTFVFAQATLENPAPNSFQSGLGVISGWACEANQIEIEFDNDATKRWQAGTQTQRTDTHGACGDTDNGFGLLFNWNLLGDGLHTVRAFADGVEFANVIVTVTTVGEEFLRDASGEVQVSDFPTPGATRTLRWQEAQQNFVLTDGRPGSRGGGTSGTGTAVLEIPQPGSFQSGLGVISGWACAANQIEIEFDNDPTKRWQAGPQTQRTDTHGTCGDTDNGFGLLFNWNLLGDGAHTVRAFADGVEFANVVVTVSTLGEEFARGLSREVIVSDFPQIGTDSILVWQEAHQNFVIAAALPTAQLVAVNPVVALPDGVSIPNVTVRSLYAETAEVLARPEPSLLIAEDVVGTVLLGFANMDGGLQGERDGSVEVSVDSTAVVLVALSAGYAVHAIDQNVVDAIRAHPTYRALIAAMNTQIAMDKNFLSTLRDYTDIMTRLQEVAGAIAPSPNARPHSLPTQGLAQAIAAASVGNETVHRREAATDLGGDSDLKRRLVVSSFAAAVANALLPTAAIQRSLQIILTEQTYPPAYRDCVETRVRLRIDEGGPRSLSTSELSELARGEPQVPELVVMGVVGALRDAEAAVVCATATANLQPLSDHIPGDPKGQDDTDAWLTDKKYFKIVAGRIASLGLVGAGAVLLVRGGLLGQMIGGVMIVAGLATVNQAKALGIELEEEDTRSRNAEKMCKECLAQGKELRYCGDADGTNYGHFECAPRTPGQDWSFWDQTYQLCRPEGYQWGFMVSFHESDCENRFDRAPRGE